MFQLKNFIAIALIIGLINSNQLEAAACVKKPLYSSNTGGCGYEEVRRTPALTAGIILGAIALAAIVAVALQDSHGGHAH